MPYITICFALCLFVLPYLDDPCANLRELIEDLKKLRESGDKIVSLELRISLLSDRSKKLHELVKSSYLQGKSPSHALWHISRQSHESHLFMQKATLWRKIFTQKIGLVFLMLAAVQSLLEHWFHLPSILIHKLLIFCSVLSFFFWDLLLLKQSPKDWFWQTPAGLSWIKKHFKQGEYAKTHSLKFQLLGQNGSMDLNFELMEEKEKNSIKQQVALQSFEQKYQLVEILALLIVAFLQMSWPIYWIFVKNALQD